MGSTLPTKPNRAEPKHKPQHTRSLAENSFPNDESALHERCDNSVLMILGAHGVESGTEGRICFKRVNGGWMDGYRASLRLSGSRDLQCISCARLSKEHVPSGLSLKIKAKIKMLEQPSLTGKKETKICQDHTSSSTEQRKGSGRLA